MYLRSDMGTGYLCPFSVTPEEFITFAKADIFSRDPRGYINALTNAKRAIDCQTDSLITSLGFDPDKLDKQIGSHGVSALKAASGQNHAPMKFRFLEALGIATPAIVAKMRQLRNALEHDYRRPRSNEVRNAIDVAELFVQACGARMRSAPESFGFGSGLTQRRGLSEVAKNFHVRFRSEPAPAFEVVFRDVETFPIKKTNKGILSLPLPTPQPEVKTTAGDAGFIPLLRLLWGTDWGTRDLHTPFARFLTDIGVKFSRTRLRVREGPL